MLIFLFAYILIKYAQQKKFLRLFLAVGAFAILAFIFKDSVMATFEIKVDHYGGAIGTEGNIASLQIDDIKDIYKLPFTIFFANLQPMTLNLFEMGNRSLWLTIIAHLNITMYPIAVGNFAYIFLKKKDTFFWVSTMIMYSSVIILSLGVFRHYLFLVPLQIINYSLCVGENPSYNQLFFYASAGLAIVTSVFTLMG